MKTADVLFLTSGTYPYYTGGVSTWADTLLSSLSQYDFSIVSLVSNPHVQFRYTMPENVTSHQILPLWGVDRPEEFSGDSARKLLIKIYHTHSRGIEDFLESFEVFLREASSGGERPRVLAEAIVQMHEFLQTSDYGTVVRDRKFWEMFSTFVENDENFSEMSLFETIETCRTVARYLQVLATDVPKCRLVHSSIADVIGFLAVISKLRDRVPYILTEHGVYYRERLLDIAGRFSKGQKAFWVNFEKAIVKLNYFYADLIAPVSKFNAQWESELGADHRKIEVIYNGVDTERFKAMPFGRSSSSPTVSAVTRIDPLKGISDLIASMPTVLSSVPNAKCLVFGSSSDSDYAEYCIDARDRLGLTESVLFMGFTPETPKAFNSGDVVTLPSISEGFPFALIEGMACEKATVATDVGGVGEALAETGILVPPRNPVELGEAIAQLLLDTQQSRNLGLAARNRILTEYTVSRFTERYRDIYRQMSNR